MLMIITINFKTTGTCLVNCLSDGFRFPFSLRRSKKNIFYPVILAVFGSIFGIETVFAVQKGNVFFFIFHNAKWTTQPMKASRYA